MRNKFKIDEEVYDEVNFPSIKGIVDYIHNDGSYWICGVSYGKSRFNYDINTIKYLSYTPYKIILEGFKNEKTKTLTNEMKVFIKGNGDCKHGEEIIKHLTKLGGDNISDLGGHAERFYYINNEFKITYSDKRIPDYEEIFLTKDTKPNCNVGKKISYNNSICLIIAENKDKIYFYDTQKYEMTYIYTYQLNQYIIS